MGGKVIKKCCEALFGKSNKQVESYKDSLIDDKFTYNSSGGSDLMPYSSTRVTLDEFIIIKTLGKGSFGKVLLVRHKISSKLYAMKVIKKELIKQRNHKNHIRNEREILEIVNNPFIVNLKFAFQTNDKLYLGTEFIQGGELYYHLHKVGFFTEELTKFYAAEMVLALEYLHKKNVIYRDLKPENVLLDKSGHIKLTDFGLSKLLKGISLSDTKTYTICGTPEYLAPEILIGKGYDKSVDWWSLGALVYEMLVGRSPFKEAKKNKLDLGIYLKPIVKHKNMSDTAFDLIKKLLNTSPMHRLGNGLKDADEIKSHPFFKEINWSLLLKRELNSPFKPYINREEDLRNFDTVFTDENPISQRDTINIRSVSNRSEDTKYDNFTFVNKSILDQNN